MRSLKQARTGGHFWGLTNYFDFNESTKKLNELIHNKQHRLNTDHASYRVINHWEKVGLIISNRPSGKGWRKFSIIEMVWIDLIVSLRKLGLSLERILDVRGSIEKSDFIQTTTPFPEMEYYVFLCLSQKIPCFLIVFPDGDAEFVHEDEYRAMINFQAFMKEAPGHICIPLNAIVQKFFKGNFESTSKMRYLSEEEEQLMNKIREGGDKSVLVSLKDDKIKQIRTKRTLSPKANISSIKKTEKNQDITVKVRDGKVVHVEQDILKKNHGKT